MFPSWKQENELKQKLETDGFYTKYHGCEHTLTAEERERFVQSEDLLSYRRRLTADLYAEKNGITTYWECKKIYNNNGSFYPEALGILFACEREAKQGVKTYYAVEMPNGVNRVFKASDYRILLHTEKLWHRPHYHPLGRDCWLFIKYWAALYFPTPLKIDTDIFIELPPRVSGDLCLVIPVSALQGLPHLDAASTIDDIMMFVDMQSEKKIKDEFSRKLYLS